MHLAPGAPQALQVEALSCKSILVRWLPPDSSLSGGLPLISYRVRYNETELYNISRVGDKLEAEVHGLQPSTSYVISVSANNTFGWGKEAVGINTTMPRLTELFHVSNVTSANLTVTATMVATHKHLQCDMSSNAKGIGNFTLTQGKEERHLVGLTPDTQYTIHCVANDKDGKDACIEQTMNVTTSKSHGLLHYIVYVWTHDVHI